MTRSLVAASAALLACASASPRPAPAAPTGSAVSLAPEQQARVEEIGRVGRELFRQDAACARASDAFLGRWNDPAPSAGGWIARADGDGYRVTFIGGPDDSPELLGDVVASGDRTEVALRPARALSAEERSMYRARQVALRAARNSCSGAFNTVILAAPEGAWDVFVLAASSEEGAIVVGGHSRIRVSGDGAIAEREPFSKSCLTLTPPPDVVAITVTHLVSDVPAPTHVYLSLLHRKTIYVAANGPGARARGAPRIWEVDGDRVTAVK